MRCSRLFVICSLASLLPVAADAQGKPSTPQVVDLKAPDGITLKASYFSAGRPGPGLLLLHACNMDRTSWSGFATDAAAKGFHVLALDFRGFGESGGQRYAPGPQQQAAVDGLWPGDVDTAFTWLTSQSPVDKTRIAAAGASCGVNQSVQLARRHPEVKTVVLLSGGVNQDARLFLRDSPWLPVLAAGSRGDGGIVDQMRWVLAWSRNPANRFVEYKAAGHGTEMFAAEKGLEPIVLEWLDTHVRSAPAKAGAAAPAKPSAAEQFWTTLTAPGGIAKARQIYHASKSARTRAVLFPRTRPTSSATSSCRTGTPRTPSRSSS